MRQSNELSKNNKMFSTSTKVFCTNPEKQHFQLVPRT